MRLMVVHPGASISTADVYTGLIGAFERQGVEIVKYHLDGRIDISGGYFKYLQRRQKDRGRIFTYTSADVVYHACQDIFARAVRFEVDWVFVVSGMYLHPDWMILLRKLGVPIAVLLTESPYDDGPQGSFIQYADIAWTNERSSVPWLRQFNPNVYYLPHAYDPAKHQKGLSLADQELPSHDVLFVGTGFVERQRILGGVNWRGIDLGLYGTWPYMGSRNKLREYIRGGYVQNQITAGLYRRSSIGLNLYRTSIGFGREAKHVTWAESLNPRALELAACGVFTISDARPEVTEVFGRLVPTFENAQDLDDLIRFYLAHPDERRELAWKLPAAVEGMTFDARAAQILRDLSTVSDRSEDVAA